MNASGSWKLCAIAPLSSATTSVSYIQVWPMSSFTAIWTGSAGAQLLPSACGVCAGYGDSFAEHETVISSTARNFKGRMGPASTQVYLASAYTVAASAIAGRIADPR